MANSLTKYTVTSTTSIAYGNPCARFKIDTPTSPFKLTDVIVETGKAHVFSFYVQSNSKSSITIKCGDFSKTITTPKGTFEKQIVKFTPTEKTVEIYFNEAKTYYIYHPKLETGSVPTDWTLSNNELMDIQTTVTSVIKKDSDGNWYMEDSIFEHSYVYPQVTISNGTDTGYVYYYTDDELTSHYYAEINGVWYNVTKTEDSSGNVSYTLGSQTTEPTQTLKGESDKSKPISIQEQNMQTIRTAEGISQTVSKNKSDADGQFESMDSKIEQTADKIEAGVKESKEYTDGQISNAEATIKLTTDAIESRVSANESNLYNNRLHYPYYFQQLKDYSEDTGYVTTDVTWKVNSDNSVTATGTAASDRVAYLNYLDNDTALLSGTQFIDFGSDVNITISGCPDQPDGWTDAYHITARFYKNGNQPKSTSAGTTADGGYDAMGYNRSSDKPIVTTNGYRYVIVSLVYKSGYSAGVTFYPMVEKGSIAHEYVDPAYCPTSVVSSITQTADEIRAEVTDEISQAETRIKITTDGITSTVTENKAAADAELSNLNSKIDQTAGSITTTVSDYVKDNVGTTNLMPSVYYRESYSGTVWENTATGITWTVNTDGSVTATGTAVQDSTFSLTNNATGSDALVARIATDPSKQYFGSGCPEGGSSSTYNIRYYGYTTDTDYTTVRDIGNGILLPDKIIKVYPAIIVKSGYDCGDGLTFYPQLEVGTKATAYASTHLGNLAGRMVGAESSITQTKDQISLVVKDGSTESSLKLTDNALSVIASDIDISGNVTFTSGVNKAIASASDYGLGMKINYSTFTTQNDGEVYFHGYDEYGTATDTDGWVYWNGNKVVIPKGMKVNPGTVIPYNQTIYIVYRLDTAIYYVWYDAASDTHWYSDTVGETSKDSGVANTPTGANKTSWTWRPSTDLVLLSYVESGSEVALEVTQFDPVLHCGDIPEVASDDMYADRIKDVEDKSGTVYATVSDWVDGAIGETTTINGGYIKTNTITADKIAIGNFTNMVTVDENDENTVIPSTALQNKNYAVKVSYGSIMKSYATQEYLQMCQKFLTSINPGESVYYSFTVRGTAGHRVQIRIHWYADTGLTTSSAYAVVKTHGLTGADDTFTGTITSAATTAYPRMCIFIRDVGTDSSSTSYTRDDIYLSNVQVYKQTGYTLIQDGCITTDKINVADLVANKIYVTGGRNLIVGTNNPSDEMKDLYGNVANYGRFFPHLKGTARSTYSSGLILSAAEHGCRVTVNSDTQTAFIYYLNSVSGGSYDSPSDKNALQKGKTYTISFDWEAKAYSGDTSSSADRYLSVVYASNTTSDGNYGGNVSQVLYDHFYTYTQAKKGTVQTGRCEWTFTVPTDSGNIRGLRIRAWTGSAVYKTGDYIEVRNLMLEEANVASSWSPAYEDISNVDNLITVPYYRQEVQGLTGDGDDSTNGITWSFRASDYSVKALSGGTATDNSWYHFTANWDSSCKNGIFFLKAGTYTLSGCPAGVGTVDSDNKTSYTAGLRISLFESTDSFAGSVASYTDYGTGATFTTDKDYYVRIQAFVTSGTTLSSGLYFLPMLTRGTDVVPYRSPGSSSIAKSIFTTGTTTIDGGRITADSITVDQITTNNLEGDNGWINLHEGTFNYGSSDTNGISWDGSELKVYGTLYVGSSTTVQDYVDSGTPIVNLLPSVYYREILQKGGDYPVAGITYTINDDGSVTATGTSTRSAGGSNHNYSFTNGNTDEIVPRINLDPDKTYFLSGCPEGGSSTTYRLRVNVWKEGEEDGAATTTLSDTGSGVKITGYTKAQPYAYIYAGYDIAANKGSDGITFYPQLEVGSTKHGYVSTHDNTYSGIARDLANGTDNYVAQIDGSLLVDGTVTASNLLAKGENDYDYVYIKNNGHIHIGEGGTIIAEGKFGKADGSTDSMINIMSFGYDATWGVGECVTTINGGYVLTLNPEYAVFIGDVNGASNDAHLSVKGEIYATGNISGANITCQALYAYGLVSAPGGVNAGDAEIVTSGNISAGSGNITAINGNIVAINGTISGSVVKGSNIGVVTNKSSSDVAVSNSTWKNVANTGSLAAGSYFIKATVQVPKATDTGFVYVVITTDSESHSGVSPINTGYAKLNSGNVTDCEKTLFVNLTDAATYYVWVYQSSGASRNVTPYIQIMRVQ